METLLLVMLIMLLGLAVFVGISIRNHAQEVERNVQAYAAQQAKEKESV
ncbi:hypothetical protein [Hymenobacter volaticus]|uniref:Uncharacterized protein n=1 Tax=Hymenobacter volaticus TaxID=2932254 RepID=A0ABY4GFD5_9BACT|nr:hypothetical protein [Hymenobacter volaticus]UOQ69636.1 hypothetical protein MUN86_29490 [Hymenobacter volaticus]